MTVVNVQGVKSDALANLNDVSAKRSKWLVRIENVKLQKYAFWAKGKQVNAEKMVCCLVGPRPTDYAQGLVPFDFRNLQRPAQAHALWKAREGDVFEITKPLLEKRTARRYVSTNVPVCIILDEQTRITPGSPEQREIPAEHAEPIMRLKSIITLSDTRNVDVAFIVSAVSETRPSKKQDQNPGPDDVVRTVQIYDDSVEIVSGAADGVEARSGAEFTVWGSRLCNEFDDKVGCAGRAFYVRARYIKDENGQEKIELHLNDSDALLSWVETPRTQHLLSQVDRLQSLPQHLVTTSFEPADGTGLLLGTFDITGNAKQTCCALLPVLLEQSNTIESVLWQMNNILIDVDVSSGLYSENGRNLYFQAILRDWSGRCQVSVLQDATFQLFDQPNKKGVEDLVGSVEDDLCVAPCLWHVRGTCRLYEGTPKIYMLAAHRAEQYDAPRSVIRRLSMHIEDKLPVGDGAFLTLPLGMLGFEPLHGLVTTIDGVMVCAHKWRIMIQGTQHTTLKKIDGDDSTRILDSEDVICVLHSSVADGSTDNDEAPSKASLDEWHARGSCFHKDKKHNSFNAIQFPSKISIRAYCSELELHQFVLNDDIAVCHVTSGVLDDPEHLVLTVDVMYKLSRRKVEVARKALLLEHRMVWERDEELLAASPQTEPHDAFNKDVVSEARVLERQATQSPAKAKNLDSLFDDSPEKRRKLDVVLVTPTPMQRAGKLINQLMDRS